jgi:hypothetical protein
MAVLLTIPSEADPKNRKFSYRQRHRWLLNTAAAKGVPRQNLTIATECPHLLHALKMLPLPPWAAGSTWAGAAPPCS